MNTTTHALARSSDPDTSQDAADTVDVSKAKAAVLLGIYMGGGYINRQDRTPYVITDEDIADEVSTLGRVVGIHTAQSLRSRRAELERAGYVECIDRLGVTYSGRSCRRYILTDDGEKIAARIYERAMK